MIYDCFTSTNFPILFRVLKFFILFFSPWYLDTRDSVSSSVQAQVVLLGANAELARRKARTFLGKLNNNLHRIFQRYQNVIANTMVIVVTTWKSNSNHACTCWICSHILNSSRNKLVTYSDSRLYTLTFKKMRRSEHYSLASRFYIEITSCLLIIKILMNTVIVIFPRKWNIYI